MAAVLSVPGINSLRTNNGSLQGSLSKLFFIRVTSPEKTRASVCLLLNPKECCFQSCVLRGFASIVQVLFTEHRYCYYKVHACMLSHVQLFATPWTRLLSPWVFPGKNTRAGCHFLLQGVFLIWGLNLFLLCRLHWQADSLSLSHLGSPIIIEDGDQLGSFSNKLQEIGEGWQCSQSTIYNN